MFAIKLKKKVLIFITFLFFISSCAIKERLKEKPVITYVEKPAELLWEDANRYLSAQNYTFAAEAFEEIDKQHPYSSLAKKSKVMAAYVYYLEKDYENSIFAIDRFINLHPADKNMPYALYLKGLCYYDQINNVDLDQTPAKNAKKTFEELPNIFGEKAEKNFLNFLKQLKMNNFPTKQIVNYYYFKIDRWDIQLQNGKTIKFPYNNVEYAIQKSIELLKRKDFEKYNIIDLRVNGKIIVE